MAGTDYGKPGIYNSTPITLATGEGSALAVNANGELIVNLESGDIEIGQVELKDSDSTAQANIKAANTARTTGTVVIATQPIDEAGLVLGRDAANTARTTATKVNPSQHIDAAGVVGGIRPSAYATDDTGMPATPAVLPIAGEYRAAATTYADGDATVLQSDVNGNLKVTNATLAAGEDLTNDVTKVEQRYSYAYCVADTQVKAGAGFVHTLTFSPLDAAATAGTIFLYDKLTEATPTIFSYYIPAAALVPVTVTLDVSMATGIYIGFTTTADVAVTVSYR